MSRPLIVCDCDEVLLHMISHFRDWLDEEEGIRFDMNQPDFVTALTYRASREVVEREEIWRLLGAFFDSEMHRQTPVPGAPEAAQELARHADFVVLTNLQDHRREARAEQLAAIGIEARVFTNQGPKGPPFAAIVEEYSPSRAIFIDDLPQHHDSVSQVAPEAGRLHFCAEPRIARRITCAHEAGHADARIDTWDEALPWLLAQLDGPD